MLDLFEADPLNENPQLNIGDFIPDVLRLSVDELKSLKSLYEGLYRPALTDFGINHSFVQFGSIYFSDLNPWMINRVRSGMQLTQSKISQYDPTAICCRVLGIDGCSLTDRELYIELTHYPKDSESNTLRAHISRRENGTIEAGSLHVFVPDIYSETGWRNLKEGILRQSSYTYEFK